MTERKLYYKDGTEVSVGDTVTSFRGEPAVIRGWDQKGRNRVYVTWGDMKDDPFNYCEYFPSVFNLEWFPETPGRIVCSLKGDYDGFPVFECI